MLLNEMEIFYQVVECHSFSKAAERLGFSKSFVSKKVAGLERVLKTRLLTRSTRHLLLTEAGEVFYQQCVKVVHEAGQAYDAITELSGQPAGTLRISAPPALGIYLLASLLPEFLQQYPQIHLEIELNHQLVDLMQEGYDLALRSAQLESSNLVAQRVLTFANILCAAPSYLKQHAAPKTLEDLAKHRFALYSGNKTATLRFWRGQHESRARVQAYVKSNHSEFIKQLVLNSVCMAVLPEFMIQQELQQQTLVRCLPEYALVTHPIYAIYPEREFVPLKVQAFLNLLKNSMQPF